MLAPWALVKCACWSIAKTSSASGAIRNADDERVYWTDVYENCLYSCRADGSDVVVRELPDRWGCSRSIPMAICGGVLGGAIRTSRSQRHSNGLLPLSLASLLRHGARVYPTSEVVTFDGATTSRVDYAEVAVRAERLVWSPEGARRRPGRPCCHLRVEHPGSPRRLLRGARHGRRARPSTSDCIPNSWPSSSTTARPRWCWSTPPSCRCSPKRRPRSERWSTT